MNSQGFRLEYRAFAALWRRFPGHCRLDDYFVSADGAPCEIDVTAQLSHWQIQRGYGFLLRVLCECKYSKSKPWVLLYGNSDPSWLISDWLHVPRTAALRDMPKLSEEQAKELQKAFHFSEGIWLAHSIVQAHTDGEQDRRGRAFDSLRKIAHAAWEFLDTAAAGATKLYGMAFPCLVLDGPLYAASFDPTTEKVQAREISYGRLCWTGCQNGTTVDVVRADAVEEYAEKLNESFITIMRVLRWVHEPGT